MYVELLGIHPEEMKFLNFFNKNTRFNLSLLVLEYAN